MVSDRCVSWSGCVHTLQLQNMKIGIQAFPHFSVIEAKLWLVTRQRNGLGGENEREKE